VLLIEDELVIGDVTNNADGISLSRGLCFVDSVWQLYRLFVTNRITRSKVQ
jgi:hypothetical protein